MRPFKKAVHALGFDVIPYNLHTSPNVLLQTILVNFNIGTVIDAGANEGQYASQIIRYGYKGKIVSFEPVPAVYQVLKQQSDGNPNWTALNLGLGNKEEELMINVSENLVSSSMYQVSSRSIEVEPTSRATRQERIKLTTVDSFFEGAAIDGEVLLKLDIQGFELEALKGALASLPRIRIVQAELSFVPLYESAPLYSEVIAFLENQGFEIFTFIPAFVDDRTGRTLQSDGIFVRK